MLVDVTQQVARKDPKKEAEEEKDRDYSLWAQTTTQTYS
ncbi:MAG: hypothetical protein ACJAY7_001533 [Pseudohongiellaceae bacterium]|jgi:hypothetical protein